MPRTVEIPLTRGKVALIDWRDLPLVAGNVWQSRPSKKNGRTQVAEIVGRVIVSMERASAA